MWILTVFILLHSGETRYKLERSFFTLWKSLSFATYIGKMWVKEPQQPTTAITLNKCHNNSYQVHIYIWRGVYIYMRCAACSYKSNAPPYHSPPPFLKPKQNPNEMWGAPLLLINFVCNSKIARKVTRTHNTHTQLNPPLHTHTHTNIYALTNVEIMQVNRLIGSSNRHTVRPEEEEEEQKEESCQENTQ